MTKEMFTFSTAVSTHSTFPAEVVDAYASKGVQKPKTCISYLSVLHFLSKKPQKEENMDSCDSRSQSIHNDGYGPRHCFRCL